jgi:geranylgeranyl pyrophosphate synthase
MSETKSRRITVDLSPSAATEVDRLEKATGKKTAALFRSAFSLLRIAINAAQSGMEIHLVDPTGAKEPVKLDLE